jgi:hypothetical protein
MTEAILVQPTLVDENPSQAINPNVFTLLSLKLAFYLCYSQPKKTILEMLRKKDNCIYFRSHRYFHSKSRYLVKSKRLFCNGGIWCEG